MLVTTTPHYLHPCWQCVELPKSLWLSFCFRTAALAGMRWTLNALWSPSPVAHTLNFSSVHRASREMCLFRVLWALRVPLQPCTKAQAPYTHAGSGDPPQQRSALYSTSMWRPSARPCILLWQYSQISHLSRYPESYAIPSGFPPCCPSFLPLHPPWLNCSPTQGLLAVSSSSELGFEGASRMSLPRACTWNLAQVLSSPYLLDFCSPPLLLLCLDILLELCDTTGGTLG